MKTRFIYLCFAVSVILLGFVVASCKKDQGTKTESQMQASDSKLAGLLQDFKLRGESNLKSGAIMSIDSAIWYIGATINFTYGDASHATEKTWIDSIFITLPIANGKITEGEVYAKYEAVIDSLRAIYQKKSEENKQLLAATITTHSVNATEVVCKLIGIFAYGFPSIPYTFNNIDSWFYWGQIQGGICNGPNSGTLLQSDAAEETQKRITYSIAVPSGTYWYETLPIVPIRDAIPIDPNSTPNNHRYSYLYWNSSQFTDFNGCIPPDDLNFYLSKTKQLIYNDTDHGGVRPIGSNLIGINMWGDSYLQIQPPNATIYLHKADVFYGILHWNPNIPLELN